MSIVQRALPDDRPAVGDDVEELLGVEAIPLQRRLVVVQPADEQQVADHRLDPLQLLDDHLLRLGQFLGRRRARAPEDVDVARARS